MERVLLEAKAYREDLNLRVKQTLRKTFWQITPYPKHKAMLEAKACSIVIVTKARK